MNKDIVFVKVKSEIAAGTRGSSLGVAAMEIAAIKDGNDIFKTTESIEIQHENDRLHDAVDTPNAIRIEGVLAVLDRLMNGVSQELNANKFPIVLSGDHSNAAGTIAGIKKANPNKRVGVVWVDAHGDLHTPYTTPSGNMHGMPVAISLGMDNTENSINELSAVERENWESLKNLGSIIPKVLPSDVVFFAVRSTEDPEEELAKKHGIKNYTVEELRYRGLETCLAEADEKLSECDIIYISFDVDSMDCDLVSYGTGTPVQKGLDREEALTILTHFYSQDKCSCIEFVEVNPLLDNKGNEMAESAFSILKSLLAIR